MIRVIYPAFQDTAVSPRFATHRFSNVLLDGGLIWTAAISLSLEFRCASQDLGSHKGSLSTTVKNVLDLGDSPLIDDPGDHFHPSPQQITAGSGSEY